MEVDIGVWRSELKRGVMEMCIMKLIEKEELYGYEIAKTLRTLTKDILNIEEGTLYPLLRRLEDRGWITGDWKIYRGRARKYYRLTPLGKRALHEMVNFWWVLVEEVSKIIGGGVMVE